MLKKTNRRPRRRSRRPAEKRDSWADDLLPFAAGAAAGGLGLLFSSRYLLAHVLRKSLRILMTEPYEENLLELYSAVSRFGVQALAESELRAASGRVIQRPLGTPKQLPNFSQLMFDLAQLAHMPTPLEAPVDLSVTIGPQANRQLRLKMPLIVAGMAYGWALSEDAKLALAAGATAAGTATNTGQGPWLDSERKAAKQLILQYHRGHWGKSEQIVRQADAIEIQFGQGAIAGLGAVLEAEHIDQRLAQQFQVKPGERAISPSRHPEVQRPEDLVDLVRRLRLQSGGVPVGVKLGAGQHLEQDMAYAVQAGVDFIAVDGAEAATKGSPPITEDDFGLPTLYALVRASRYLEEARVRDRISLIISGGLKTPGEFLKALALGADAVYIGTAALFAISHTQVVHTVPYEPPTQLVWYRGSAAKRFDWQAGARSLANYLSSCAAEMQEGVRALGKCKLSEVNRSDLVALDQSTAEICGVALGYRSPERQD